MDHGRQRHYSIDGSGLASVAKLLDELRAAPPFVAAVFDGLDLEVCRTVRERSATPQGDNAQDWMSTTTPPGRRETRDGVEQTVFTRTFAAPLGDGWAACTEPERMER